jgi:ribonuclease HI
MITEDELYIYTDGSSISKPRRGGIGIRYIIPNYNKGTEEYIDESKGSYTQATNNQMELLACIEALKGCVDFEGFDKVGTIYINTDSRYVKNHIDFAKYTWPKNYWATSTGEPVQNIQLWKDLIKQLHKFSSQYRIRVQFNWVRGHSGDVHNNRVDKLAKNGAKSPLKIIFNYVDVRRKITDKTTRKGSVKIKGQRIKIRIIGCEYIKQKKIYKMRYELMSEKSDYFGMVDFIYYSERLREGHTYLVSVKKDANYPQISRVKEEIITNIDVEKIEKANQ